MKRVEIYTTPTCPYCMAAKALLRKKGVSFEETGRFISCYENSARHMDLLPAEALMRHPNLAKLAQRGGRGGVANPDRGGRADGAQQGHQPAVGANAVGGAACGAEGEDEGRIAQGAQGRLMGAEIVRRDLGGQKMAVPAGEGGELLEQRRLPGAEAADQED